MCRPARVRRHTRTLLCPRACAYVQAGTCAQTHTLLYPVLVFQDEDGQEGDEAKGIASFAGLYRDRVLETELTRNPHYLLGQTAPEAPEAPVPVLSSPSERHA